MIEKIAHYKVEHFFNSNFVKDLAKISIFKNSDGSYSLFDKYTISTKNKIHTINTNYSHTMIDFYSLQNAVTWCIFTEKNKFAEAARIHRLDKLIESVNFSILCLKSKLNKSKELSSTVIYSGKLSQDEAKKQTLLHELTGYRQQANYWKNHDFYM